MCIPYSDICQTNISTPKPLLILKSTTHHLAQKIQTSITINRTFSYFYNRPGCNCRWIFICLRKEAGFIIAKTVSLGVSPPGFSGNINIGKTIFK